VRPRSPAGRKFRQTDSRGLGVLRAGEVGSKHASDGSSRWSGNAVRSGWVFGGGAGTAYSPEILHSGRTRAALAITGGANISVRCERLDPCLGLVGPARAQGGGSDSSPGKHARASQPVDRSGGRPFPESGGEFGNLTATLLGIVLAG
jgi:hypothetical protein